MNPFGLRSATRSLVRMQSKAGLTRIARRFRSRRRIALTVIGVVLAVAWIGQAVAGILFRESANLEQLQQWIPLSLAAYALWNLIKITFRKPVRPFEWTGAEEEWLISAPIDRGELIGFRMATIFRTAIFKAAIFSLVMIPDLPLLPFGFVGMLTGLMVIDLARMLTEVAVWGLTKQELYLVRCSVGAFVLAAVAYVLIGTLKSVRMTAGSDALISLELMWSLFEGVCSLSTTWPGRLVRAPFQIITDVILASSLSYHSALSTIGLGTTIWILFRILVRLDGLVDRRNRGLETARLPTARSRSEQTAPSHSAIRPRRQPVRVGGLGPLAWRQLLGARHYRGQLMFALAIPLFLCCLPALSGSTGLMLVMQTTGGLAFYSFLLLPSSMPFDMRRDLERFSVLKSLPLSPLRIVLGQISAPVILTSVFQLATLAVTMLISPFQPAYLLIAIAILWPFNLIVFGLENLMIIWYPYRLNQEGVQIFLRSILAFTAKGMLFALAAAGILVWAFVAKWLGNALLPDAPQLGMSLFFLPGAVLGLVSTATAVIRMLAKSFERFDPTCDLAGLD